MAKKKAASKKVGKKSKTARKKGAKKAPKKPPHKSAVNLVGAHPVFVHGATGSCYIESIAVPGYATGDKARVVFRQSSVEVGYIEDTTPTYDSIARTLFIDGPIVLSSSCTEGLADITVTVTNNSGSTTKVTRPSDQKAYVRF